MGSVQATTEDGDHLDIQTALRHARENESGIGSAVNDFLENTLKGIWDRIQARPHSYILSKDEFAVFNFFRDRFRDQPFAETAVARFWQHHQEDPARPVADTDSSTTPNYTTAPRPRD